MSFRYCSNIAVSQQERCSKGGKISFWGGKIRAGQVRKLVRKSANPQLRTNGKSCGHADLRTLAV